ncbi:hypothetical protein OCHUTO_0299 [Orientia chuto str. Dubai]|uniref:Uncharacterized protein n=1 Tax=Orientia chuto str. Dubai TaxID=1359168 RepID=A0A0F3MQL8_9RICK|nr:hypothetical protein OCHUTO_0299 [Orientia chuto str. Dubai]
MILTITIFVILINITDIILLYSKKIGPYPDLSVREARKIAINYRY